jgi:hypothetical protein
MHLQYPYQIDHRRRTARTPDRHYIRNLMEQLLFTMPGERVNRPEFGSGLMQLIHAPNSDELATATQFLIQSAFQQWLGDIIQVEAVDVQAEDSTLTITIVYSERTTQERQVAQFVREV